MIDLETLFRITHLISGFLFFICYVVYITTTWPPFYLSNAGFNAAAPTASGNEINDATPTVSGLVESINSGVVNFVNSFKKQ